MWSMVQIREAVLNDIPAIFAIRTAVKENSATMQRLAELGITPAYISEGLKSHYKGWVADDDGRVVGFSIADKTDNSIWAMFVLPDFESRGLGRALMARAVEWLLECGADRIWLTTGPDTRAAGFYLHLGWTPTGTTSNGETRFELGL
jgi:GNAT superfamily N-acetyltransferase